MLFLNADDFVQCHDHIEAKDKVKAIAVLEVNASFCLQHKNKTRTHSLQLDLNKYFNCNQPLIIIKLKNINLRELNIFIVKI